MNYITDREIDRLQGAVGAELAAQDRVRMLIKDDGSGQPWEGGINGYFFRIRRGEIVELPAGIASLIQQSRQVEIMGETGIKAYKENRGRRMEGGRE